MNSFSDVIELWARAEELATDVGEKPDTVRKWKQRNSIPSDKWAQLLKAAKRRKFKLDASILVRLAASRSAA